MLEQIAADLRSGKVKATAAVAVLLNREGDDYDVGRYFSHLLRSEAIALLEIAKSDTVAALHGDKY
jgi:hypothetical protein